MKMQNWRRFIRCLFSGLGTGTLFIRCLIQKIYTCFQCTARKCPENCQLVLSPEKTALPSIGAGVGFYWNGRYQTLSY